MAKKKPTIESNLLTRVAYHPEEMKDLELRGFEPNALSAPYAAAFKEATKFMVMYGEFPPARTLMSRVKGISIGRSSPKRKAIVYWDTIRWWLWRNDLVGTVQEVSEMFPDDLNDSDQSLDLAAITQAGLTKFSEVSAKYASDSERPVLLGEVADDLVKEQEDSGSILAIPIPFDFIQEEIRGFKAGQIYIVAGRPKTGKTWFALICAAYAIMKGYRVLLTSLEMRAIEIARRMACIIGKISYNRCVKRTMKPQEKQRYYELLRSLKKGKLGQRVQIVGPGVAKGPETVGTLHKAFGAHFVIVDAFYNMQSGSDQDREWEKVLALMRKYRRVSLPSEAAWMLVTQFNRGGKSRRGANLDNLGFTDAIGQDANALLYVVRSNYLKKARQVDLILGEAREADDSVAFRHFWDFVEMRWDAVGAVQYGSDDEEV
jgi:replicative DNA helicase